MPHEPESETPRPQGHAIAVCGPIAAGKTTIVQAFAAKYRWDVLSFGDHIRTAARVRGLPATRTTWQRLGTQLLGELGAARFVRQVLTTSQPRSAVHLYDGPRDMALLAELNHLYERLVVIYLDPPAAERYARWATRQQVGDPDASREAFERMNNEQIERRVPAICSIADAVFGVGLSIPELMGRIEHLLVRRGYPDVNSVDPDQASISDFHNRHNGVAQT